MTDTVTNAKRGPKTIFEKREKMVKALRAVQNGATEDRPMPSRYHLMQLAEAGLVQFEKEPTGGRGRPRHIAQLTEEGIAHLAQL